MNKKNNTHYCFWIYQKFASDLPIFGGIFPKNEKLPKRKCICVLSVQYNKHLIEKKEIEIVFIKLNFLKIVIKDIIL